MFNRIYLDAQKNYKHDLIVLDDYIVSVELQLLAMPSLMLTFNMFHTLF